MVALHVIGCHGREVVEHLGHDRYGGRVAGRERTEAVDEFVHGLGRVGDRVVLEGHLRISGAAAPMTQPGARGKQ